MNAPPAKPEPLRFFIDSNVLFSGFCSPEGPPGKILEYIARGDIEAIVSRQVLEEVVRTINRKLPEALPALKDFLLNVPLEVISDPDPKDISRWTEALPEGDAAIIAAAIAAMPDRFVTGDRHFLDNRRVGKESGLVIRSPREALEDLGA